MAGIGEATAAFSVLQVGFSIARTLTTYIADVRDAREDVRSLASELDSTLIHLEELGRLSESNKRTRGWNKSGERLAENCAQESAKVANQILELLSHSTSNLEISPGKDFKREDIDLTKFQKASWPIYKPQVEVAKRELQAIKLSIMLARDVYLATAGPTRAEKDRATVRLAGLKEARRDARRQLKRAEIRATRTQDRLTGRPRHRPRSTLDPLQSDPDVLSDTEDTSPEDVEVVDYEELRIEWEEDYDRQREIVELEEREKKAEIARIEENAVAEYKKTMLDAIKRNEQDTDGLRKNLEIACETLTKTQIDKFINLQQPQFKEEELSKLSDLFSRMAFAGITPNAPENDLTSVTSSRRKSRTIPRYQWSRSHDNVPFALSKAEEHPDYARVLSLMVKLDEAQPAIAPLHISVSHLVESIKAEERETARSGSVISNTMKTWEVLSESCRALVEKWLEESTEQGTSWSLVFARANLKKISRRQRLFMHLAGASLNRAEPSSILLVYRYSRFLRDVVRPRRARFGRGSLIQEGSKLLDDDATTYASENVGGSNTGPTGASAAPTQPPSAPSPPTVPEEPANHSSSFGRSFDGRFTRPETETDGSRRRPVINVYNEVYNDTPDYDEPWRQDLEFRPSRSSYPVTPTYTDTYSSGYSRARAPNSFASYGDTSRVRTSSPAGSRIDSKRRDSRDIGFDDWQSARAARELQADRQSYSDSHRPASRTRSTRLGDDYPTRRRSRSDRSESMQARAGSLRRSSRTRLDDSSDGPYRPYDPSLYAAVPSPARSADYRLADAAPYPKPSENKEVRFVLRSRPSPVSPPAPRRTRPAEPAKKDDAAVSRLLLTQYGFNENETGDAAQPNGSPRAPSPPTNTTVVSSDTNEDSNVDTPADPENGARSESSGDDSPS